jgi:hypothetical protein
MNVAAPPARGQALGKAVLAAIGLRLLLVPVLYGVNSVLFGAHPSYRVVKTVTGLEAGLRGLTTMLVAVLFMIWVRSEIVALRASGVPTKTTPLMAILGWFIPFANFVFPVLAVNEIYKHRVPKLGSALPIVWWVSYLASMVTTNVALPFPVAMLATLLAFGTWFAVVWNVVQAPAVANANGGWNNTTWPAQQYQPPPPQQPYY